MCDLSSQNLLVTLAEAAAAVVLTHVAEPGRVSQRSFLPVRPYIKELLEGRPTRFDVTGGVHYAAVGLCTINGRDSLRCSYAIALPSHRSLSVLPWLSALLSRQADHI
jgi:hypothetical protein